MPAKRYKRKKRVRAEVTPGGRHAIAGIDPGGTSGLFVGVVTIEETMKKTALTLDSELWFTQHFEGNFLEQAIEITDEVRAWIARVNMAGVSLDNVHVVFEDWDTGRPQHGREIVSAWIAAATHALLCEGLNAPIKDDQVGYATASQAKSYAKNGRLNLWGIYELTKGMPHARDASRHWALEVNRLVG